MQFIIRDGNRTPIGPLSLASVEASYLDGSISINSEVFDSKAGRWVPFREVFRAHSWLNLGASSETISDTFPPVLESPSVVPSSLEASSATVAVVRTPTVDSKNTSRDRKIYWGLVVLLTLGMVGLSAVDFKEGFGVVLLVSALCSPVAMLIASPFLLIRRRLALFPSLVLGLAVGGLVFAVLLTRIDTSMMRFHRFTRPSNLVAQNPVLWLTAALPSSMTPTSVDLPDTYCNSASAFSGRDEKIEVTLMLYEMKPGQKFDLYGPLVNQQKGLDSVLGPNKWSVVPDSIFETEVAKGHRQHIAGQDGNNFVYMRTLTLAYPEKGIWPERGVIIIMVGIQTPETLRQMEAITKSIYYRG